MLKTLILLTFYLLNAQMAFANDDGLIGFELALTNAEIAKGVQNSSVFDMPSIHQDTFLGDSSQQFQETPWNQATRRWLEEIKKICPTCIINNNIVHTPDGFWFEITFDINVLEVITEPMTLKKFKERSKTFKQLIWEAGKKAGVTPHKRLGGGHVHLDIKSHFGNNRLLFRNFIVDLMNRPELFMGGFGLNYFNPPVSFYNPRAQQLLIKLISDFDHDPQMSIIDFMNKMNEFYEMQKHPMLPTPYAKFQAVNLKHTKMGTVEIRTIRPQVSEKHAIKLVKMFQSRIKTLKKKKKPIKVSIPDLSGSFSHKREKGYRIYSHTLEPSKIMAAVEDYAKDGGLPKSFYSDFVTEELKADLKNETKSKPKKKKSNTSKYVGSCGAFL